MNPWGPPIPYLSHQQEKMVNTHRRSCWLALTHFQVGILRVQLPNRTLGVVANQTKRGPRKQFPWRLPIKRGARLPKGSGPACLGHSPWTGSDSNRRKSTPLHCSCIRVQFFFWGVLFSFFPGGLQKFLVFLFALFWGVCQKNRQFLAIPRVEGPVGPAGVRAAGSFRGAAPRLERSERADPRKPALKRVFGPPKRFPKEGKSPHRTTGP